MKFTLEKISGPSVEPVTLAEIRRQTRQFSDVTADDTDLNFWVSEARGWAENFTGRILVEQRWRLTIDGYLMGYFGDDVVVGYRGIYPGSTYRAEWQVWWTRGEIMLHKSPVIAIASFVSVDRGGVETAIDAANYELREKDSKWPKIVPLNGANWPSGTLRITYRAGFAAGLGSPDPAPDVANVPEMFKQAIRLRAEAFYDRDKDMMPLLLAAAENLLRSERSELSLA